LVAPTKKTRKNAIVECLDYQIRVNQRQRPKGDGDMESAKRGGSAPPTRDLNIWLYGRQIDFSLMGGWACNTLFSVNRYVLMRQMHFS